MVQLKNYLVNTTISDITPLPLLNELFAETFTQFGNTSKTASYKDFIAWVRRSPQLWGFINIIATDILSDDIGFKALGEKTSGRNRILRSKLFWTKNKGREVLEETLYDMLTLGVGYNWVGKLSDIQVKEICNNAWKKLNPNLETKAVEDLTKELIDSKEIDMAKKLRHVAASTVSIQSNKYSIEKYVQVVGANTKYYSPEEIIQMNLLPFDGKVYPFPPMEAILSEIYLLWLITENYKSYFENGGHPDKIFVLPKEIAGSKNHNYLVETLKKYKKVQNKHGNLVFTGDIKVEDLMKFESQMENKDLSLYLVGVLAMFYGIPAGRIPFLIGKAANNGDAGGLADSGYWRKISVWQSKIEEALNSELFIPYFGTEIKFSRGYKQDEVREVQVDAQKTAVANERIRAGLWTEEDAADYLGIDPEVIRNAMEKKKERDAEQLKLMQESAPINAPLPNGKVIDEPDKQAKNNKKSETQKNNQTNAGGKKVNP